MKVQIYSDEAYPVYGVSAQPSSYGRTIEISDEFYAEYEAVEAIYQAMQDKLCALAHQQDYPPKPPSEPLLTPAEAEAIKATTPVEPPEHIEAALAAFNARHKAA